MSVLHSRADLKSDKIVVTIFFFPVMHLPEPPNVTVIRIGYDSVVGVLTEVENATLYIVTRKCILHKKALKISAHLNAVTFLCN